MENHTSLSETRKNDSDYFSRIISEKVEVYNNSPLTDFHDHLLKIFFDLAQQHDGLDSFYQICVAIPQALHPEIRVSLAVLKNTKKSFQLACGNASQTDISPQMIAKLPLQTAAASYSADDVLFLPVISRPLLNNSARTGAFFPEKNENTEEGQPCLGVLFISYFKTLGTIDRLFLEKLVTRIGYNLQRRILQASHLEHINFLKHLGRDIGHNVIIPNMHFKNLFRQLEKKINRINKEVQVSLNLADEPSLKILNRCNEIRADLTSTHAELLEHYNRTSLYLETLLREEHFTKGEYILKRRRCQIEAEIIIPELEVYRRRLERQGITVEQPQNMRDRRFFLKGDLGLLSQVFDNLFSNALKYTRTSTDFHGQSRKAIAYGCQDIPNFPKKGRRGVKFNIFSTGEHLNEEERLTIFNDGVRGENVGFNPGSGHGLSFVRTVVEIHGGDVGYEAVFGGNNFYFILPLTEESDDLNTFVTEVATSNDR